MASSADPINHDGISTVATVGDKAVKYGAMTGLLALALPIALGAATLFLGVPAIVGAVAAGSVTSALVAGGLTLLGGIATFLTTGYAGASAVIGGGLGALKGASQVSRESGSFRSKIMEKMEGRENKMAKSFNDGEVKGLDEGYALAVKDMAPRLEAAKQEGREEVVQAIQMQMMQAQQAEQAQHANAADHGKKHADKFAPHTTVECKAEAIIKERHDKAAAPHQLT
jgi:hypothetical protein